MNDKRFLQTAKRVLLPLGLVACGAMAIVTALDDPPTTAAPVLPDTDAASLVVLDFSGLADDVQSDFELNEALSDSAPQQQVVASWAIKDLDHLLVTQSGETNSALEAINDNVTMLLEAQRAVVTAAATPPPVDDRTPRTIMWAAVALCWFGLWSVVRLDRRVPAGVVVTPAASPTVAVPEAVASAATTDVVNGAPVAPPSFGA